MIKILKTLSGLLTACFARLGLAPDKIEHHKAGIVAAIFGAVLGAVLVALAAYFLQVALLPIVVLCASACAVVAATVAGVSKEAADRLDNRLQPGMHEVSWQDAAATATGSAWIVMLIGLLHWLLLRH